jgi:methionyl-tRNA formyltransferase
MNPDIIVTCAYGQIIPKEILDYPKYGCINVHASLLPKYRGGAPIHRAIMSGEKETGITIMYMDVGMDSGDIITQEKVKRGNDTTVGELHDELSILGRDLLLKTLPSIFEGTNNRTVQNQDEVTFGYIIKREDELVNFDDTSNNVHNKIRGLSPYPCAYGLLDNKVVKLYKSELGSTKSSEKPGTIIKIYDDGIGVKTSDGEVIIKELQFEGKKKMLVSNYLNGIDKNKLIGKMFSIE